MRSRDRRACWPGLDLRGQTLAEIRRQIRGDEGGGVSLPPGVRKIGDMLAWVLNKGELPSAKNE